MGYVLAQIKRLKVDNLYKKTSTFKAAVYLSKSLQIDIKLAQKLCDQKRVYCGKIFDDKEQINLSDFRLVLDANLDAFCAHRKIADENLKDLKILSKSDAVDGDLFVIVYAAKSLGLKPVYENCDFAVFNKPSGLLTHPNGRDSKESLCDELWFRYGANASVAHRLDAATSGLLLCAKHKEASVELKNLMQNNQVVKEYLLLARGRFYGDFCVHLPLGLNKDAKDLKNKMHIAKPFGAVDGKSAKSEFFVLKNGFYKAQPASLLRCRLLTGRQHQIRAHLAAIDSAVLGDTLYGVDELAARKHLDGEKILTSVDGADRLMLHSAHLKFSYKNKDYEFSLPAEFDLD